MPRCPAKSVKELIALAKAKPGQVMFGSPGVGTSPHLTAELFKLQAGCGYAAGALQGLRAGLREPHLGRSARSCSRPCSPQLPHVKSGKIRALGVTTKKRVVDRPRRADDRRIRRCRDSRPRSGSVSSGPPACRGRSWTPLRSACARRRQPRHEGSPRRAGYGRGREQARGVRRGHPARAPGSGRR